MLPPPGCALIPPRSSLPEDLSPLIEHLLSVYPEEGCGLILRGPGGFRIQPIDNAYDRLRAQDPARYPRSARTAYELDPTAWLKASLEAERRGESIACVYHSHCDASANFSAEDRALAAPGGAPLLPGAHYLVVALAGRRVERIRICWWDHGDFMEADFPLPLNAI
ncbi:MAG: M67 family metallopeptidase [Myxococcaceae bacterium]